MTHLFLLVVIFYVQTAGAARVPEYAVIPAPAGLAQDACEKYAAKLKSTILVDETVTDVETACVPIVQKQAS